MNRPDYKIDKQRLEFVRALRFMEPPERISYLKALYLKTRDKNLINLAKSSPYEKKKLYDEWSKL